MSFAPVLMSVPKMRADPADGGWNPRRVWSRVVLPAPLGPSRPMQRPVREALNPLRIGRPPNLTSRPWSSMTGCEKSAVIMVVSLQGREPDLPGGLRRLSLRFCLVHHPDEAAHAGQRAEVQTQGVLVAAGEDDAVRLRVGIVEGRALRGEQLAELGRAVGVALGGAFRQHLVGGLRQRREVLVDQG